MLPAIDTPGVAHAEQPSCACVLLADRKARQRRPEYGAHVSDACIPRGGARAIHDHLHREHPDFPGSHGEKIVTNLADTSSDAPNKFAAPKRDLYDKMNEEGQIEKGKLDR